MGFVDYKVGSGPLLLPPEHPVSCKLLAVIRWGSSRWPRGGRQQAEAPISDRLMFDTLFPMIQDGCKHRMFYSYLIRFMGDVRIFDTR